jgi:hypothetical protein
LVAISAVSLDPDARLGADANNIYRLYVNDVGDLNVVRVEKHSGDYKPR